MMVPDLIEGRAVFAAAFDDLGSADPARPATTATPGEGDEWLLEGIKPGVAFAPVPDLLVVSAAGLLYHLYRFSHRIAGPMINIRRALNAIQDGRLDTRIKLRKHDLLMEAADDLNVFLDWLQEHPPTGVPTAAPADEGVETPATAIASHAGSAS